MKSCSSRPSELFLDASCPSTTRGPVKANQVSQANHANQANTVNTANCEPTEPTTHDTGAASDQGQASTDKRLLHPALAQTMCTSGSHAKHARNTTQNTLTQLHTSAQRLEQIYQRYYDLAMAQSEGVYAGHTYAEPYLRIALKAEHQLKQTLALLAQLEAKAAQQSQQQAQQEQQASLFEQKEARE